ncbi:MAG: hypothetical protein ACREBJ_10505, partial [Nitrosotalea sp.]
PRLRKAAKLREIIYNELFSKWKAIQKVILNNSLKVHEKWKEGSGFSSNICIIDIDEGEISILYKRLSESDKYADLFSEEFKGLLMNHTDSKKIGTIIKDKIKAHEILKRQTISLLFSNLPEAQKTKLLANDNKIMSDLNIKEFIDISNIQKVDLEKVLSEYIPQNQVTDASQKVLKERDDYVAIIRELNLF